MDAVSGFYETADIDSLISDFLSFPKFDRSIVLVKDGRRIPRSTGIITQPLSVLIYIKPIKAQSLEESIIVITTLFNEYSPIMIGDKSITLKQFLESHVDQ